MTNTTDALTGAKTTQDQLGATTLTFKEDGIESTFKIIEVGTPGVTEVGDGLSYKANLINSNNVLVGTKDISFVFTKQQKNGDFIAFVKETVSLPGGDIFTQGSINANKLEDLIPQRIDIVGGTGIYANAQGKETITQLDRNVEDVANISLKIV
ncbi:MAG: hypothetical protein PUP91_16355 [Rhizonema sp. PD37]|nr:hypothetical protein [Rhizonema sp. PD37]